MTDALAITELTVNRSGRPIVQDVSAAIARASWFGVIGANGSGKTTLLRAISGRLPIGGGSCMIFGEEQADDRGARAQTIGFAPPIEHLPALLRVYELLDLAGDPVKVQQERNAGLWQALGIGELLDVPVGECSSGMRQRAALALAFAVPSRIVILDEPFNWLDPVAAFDVRAVLAGMVKEGLTLITALHDLTTLCGFCDSGVVLAKGRVSLQLDEARLRAGWNDAAQFERELVAALR
ncbi:MAG: ABC transporter ATP-binding protein [Erythrobacter sp.]|uniref:ATP-binding cassette domain-containing protein n=1 Tax=Erythrobacter sp. TaxID=1042 RepID=UPI0025FB2F47|nr:ABC transporter ATP-binding protein [Erythrobacter sp.]MCM0000738.1 ABC transporter ATP-binding protein [Erythrobacter sp.]